MQIKALYDHLNCEKEFMVFSDKYSAGSHCQPRAFAQSFAGKFDWLDDEMEMAG